MILNELIFFLSIRKSHQCVVHNSLETAAMFDVRVIVNWLFGETKLRKW